MATSTMVPLSEYLETTYHPDCDWVDGEVRERNLGEGSHSSVQKFLIGFFLSREKELGVLVWPEQRVQVAATRFRIPDVCLTRQGDPFEEIIRVPPLLCIKILSKDDRMSDLLEKIDDFYRMGVSVVWVIDPRRRQAFSAKSDGTMQAEETRLVVEGTAIQVPVGAIFQELNELQGHAKRGLV